MNYGEIKTCDIANGLGVRISLFVSGCRNCCPHCFNKVTWDFNYGKKYTLDVENQIIDYLRPSYIQGLTILGGEPLEIENQQEVLNLILRVRKELPNKDIWLYSGFTFEQITGKEKARCTSLLAQEILNNIDVLVDGLFEEDKKSIKLLYRGSSNQRVIDMKKTRLENYLIEYQFPTR